MSGPALTLVGVAFVALCGLVGTLGASSISNRAAARQEAASERQRAAQAAVDAKKVDREEFDSLTRELRLSLADVRHELSTERDARQESDQRAALAEQRALAAERRASRGEDRIDRLTASLAAHAQWDLLILAEVRKTTPDFPDPPPVDLRSADET